MLLFFFIQAMFERILFVINVLLFIMAALSKAVHLFWFILLLVLGVNFNTMLIGSVRKLLSSVKITD